MRDPDLVFRAQAAASALERAWQRWRVIHGLVADPMPTISSYVGYSLEEPWGQPRVVFGLAAEDAEQLAALLDRHDCIGPVHAMIAAQPGARDPLPGAGADPNPSASTASASTGSASTASASTGSGSAAGQPLPVPPQVPPIAAEQRRPDDPRRPAKPETWRAAGRPDDRDGPVFRQVAAAARQAAAKDAAGGPRASAAPADVMPADDAGAQGADQAPAGQQRVVELLVAEPRYQPGTGQAEPGASDQPQAQQHDDATGAASPAGSPAAAETSVPGQAADGPGPLALAASAARVEAEARIRAALKQFRSSGAGHPAGDSNGTGPAADVPPGGVSAAGPDNGGTGTGPSMPCPEAASGAQTWPADGSPETADPGACAGDAASTWGGPGLTADTAPESGLVPYLPRPEQDADLDADPDENLIAEYDPGAGHGMAADQDLELGSDPATTERPDHQLSGYPRRNRITRGYSIPRLSRSKRPGAVPGT